MFKFLVRTISLTLLVGSGCSSDNTNSQLPDSNTGGAAGSAGVSGATGLGNSGTAGTAGGGATGTSGAAGSAGTAGGTGGSGGAASGAGGVAGGTGGVAGTAGGGAAGVAGGGSGGISGAGGFSGGVNTIPNDYTGTPFTTLTIPGTIISADYDRGGADVAWCHEPGNCGGGTVTGDYPGGAGVYRPAMPNDAQICGGAACDDNVGVCRMNPAKPDNTIDGDPMPPEDTYLCYTTTGTWTKYTVIVTEPGTYVVSGVLASMLQEAGFNLSFGDTITTGDVAVTVTSNANSGSGENYHSWEDRDNLATVTFAEAGSYLMTFTQTGRFNSSSFTFTKM